MKYRTKVVTIAWVAILVVSTFTPVVGSSPPTMDGGEYGADSPAPADRMIPGSPGAESSSMGAVPPDGEPDGEVSPELREQSGIREVVVRLSEAAVSRSRSQGRARASVRAARVSTLKRHARNTRGSVVRYAKRTDGVTVENTFWLTNAVLLEVDLDEIDLDEIASIDDVERIHPNFEVRVPDPQNRSTSRSEDGVANATDTTHNTTYGVSQINATDVWREYGTKGAGIKVAVLDTGVDPDHPDIELHTENESDETHPGGWAEFDDEGDQVTGSVPHDTDVHGTHTSGTVAGGNASGVHIGVAPKAELMHGLVLPDGQGSFAQIVGGMQWATANGADVISMSLGAEGYYAQMIDPVRNAEAAGTVVVASAGNDGEGSSGTPGNVYESISVGASDEHRGIALFSSGETIDTSTAWGSGAPAEWPETYVVPDVAAPGVDVRSAVPGGGYESYSGTSMAAPHVAGAVALLLATAGGDASVGEVEYALRTTATKPSTCTPECSPRNGNDTRYGAGIIDARDAAALVASESGVTGIVTGENGTPIGGAAVTLSNGFATETNDSGAYRLRTLPGEYTMRVSEAFGYENTIARVTVRNGSFAARNVTLAERLAVRLRSDQRDGIEAGEKVSVRFDVANLDTYTVTRSGGYAGNATLSINGDDQQFGEPIAFDDYSGRVTVTVRTEENETGTLALDHSFEGPGEGRTVSTGPTAVFGEDVKVGVVDTASGRQYGTDVANALDGSLPVNFRTSVINGTDAATRVVDEYDVFVVQNFTQNRESVEAFVDATERGDVGIVYLNQYGPVSNAITKRTEVTGNPRVLRQQARFYNYNDVFYNLSSDHPIVRDVGEPSDRILLQEIGWFDWFRQYDGSDRIAKVGYTSCGYFGCSNNTYTDSTALASDGLSRTVLASSLGRIPPVQNDQYTDKAGRILANSVIWANDTPPVTVGSGQPRSVSPEEAVEVTFDVNRLQRGTIRLDGDYSTITEENLTLTVDGEPRAFGETIDFANETGTVTVRVDPVDGTTGSLSLDYAFLAGDDETVTGSTGPTTVYEPPIDVPEDADTLQEAVDIAPAGAEIVVGEGTYEPVNVRNAENHDLTIRNASGAIPIIETSAERGDEHRRPGIRVAADNVSVSGFRIDVATHWDNGISVTDASNVHVSDVRIDGGERGVAVGASYSTGPNTTVENTTITGAKTGIRVYHSPGVVVRNNSVSNASIAGIFTKYSNESAVRNNEISGSKTGIALRSWNYNGAVERNTIRNSSTGIGIDALSTGKQIKHNVITNASTGLHVDGVPWFDYPHENTVEFNRIDATTGVHIEAEPNAFTFRFNHLAATETAIKNDNRDAVDGRLNYYGERGPEDTTVKGNVTYDPFLTKPPGEIDEDSPTAIGTDLVFEAGETYSLGVPGPTDQTIDEILGADFEGDVYRFKPRAKKWKRVTGNGRNARVDPLDAFKVDPDTDTRAVVTFRTDSGKSEVGGKHRFGRQRLVEGWNFVAAPLYGPVETAFAGSSASIARVNPKFTQPTSQLGPPGELNGSYSFGAGGSSPNASAFRGYFVYVEDRATLSPSLSSNPTMRDLYENLAIDPPTGSERVGEVDVDSRRLRPVRTRPVQNENGDLVTEVHPDDVYETVVKRERDDGTTKNATAGYDIDSDGFTLGYLVR